MYIEDWIKFNVKNKSQLSCTMFLEKYGSLALYYEDLKKIFIIDHEQIQFDKNVGCTLTGIPEKPDVTLSDHEYFCIHGGLFDRNQSTNQDINIMWKFISNEPNNNESRSEATEIHDDKIQSKKRSTTKYSTKHTLQRKRQKVDYRGKIDDFRLMTVDPPPKLNSEESYIFSSCFVTSMENQSNELISNMALTNLLKRWEENNSPSHPRLSDMSPLLCAE